MNTRLVECVPNVSEGRDKSVIKRIADAFQSVTGVHVLDIHVDPWHHRSVFTLVGPVESMAESAFRGVERTARLIDMTRHRGEHARMGAADVIPFVPLRGSSPSACRELAVTLGRRVGEELGIPVFLYAEAALRPERRNLPSIRNLEFETLRERVGIDPDLTPDFGPPALHPTAGATAVGARGPLVAFNVFLASPDVDVARAIARRIRTSSGGLPGVQARGFLVDGVAQVSMNLLEPERTAPHDVYAVIARLAAEHDTAITRSEIVGLAPAAVLPPDVGSMLRLREPTADKILEEQIQKIEAWWSNGGRE